MTTIAIVPERPGTPAASYRAIAGKVQSVGKTAGQALDALTEQLGETATGTLVVVQNLRPDSFFNAPQQQRLEDLMRRWREARDGQRRLPAQEQAELEILVDAELTAAAERAAALVRELAS